MKLKIIDCIVKISIDKLYARYDKFRSFHVLFWGQTIDQLNFSSIFLIWTLESNCLLQFRSNFFLESISIMATILYTTITFQSILPILMLIDILERGQNGQNCLFSAFLANLTPLKNAKQHESG